MEVVRLTIIYSLVYFFHMKIFLGEDTALQTIQIIVLMVTLMLCKME